MKIKKTDGVLFINGTEISDYKSFIKSIVDELFIDQLNNFRCAKIYGDTFVFYKGNCLTIFSDGFQMDKVQSGLDIDLILQFIGDVKSKLNTCVDNLNSKEIEI